MNLQSTWCVRALLVGVVFVVPAAIGSAAAAGAINAAASRVSEERTSVTLGEGKRGVYRWRSELRPAGKLHGGKLGSICINSVVIELTEGSEFENCGPVLGNGRLEVSRAGTKVQPIMVLSMVFEASARSVYLKRLDHPGRTFALRRLGAKRLASISDVPLSSFAHAFGGPFCLERYVVYDASGHEVADGGKHFCHSS